MKLILYGEGDRILLDFAKTVKRLEQEHASMASLPGCGHFLQEDCSKDESRILREFVN